ncbi:MAG: hypothetical protein ACFE8Z_05350 [Candidatus Hermodarchaeota archaeon]
MDIPILTSFIEGLKLFWASRRLRWLTILFIIGSFVISILGRIGVTLIAIYGPGVVAPFLPVFIFVAGVWPIYFLIALFLALVGLQRFLASDESYLKSFIGVIPWMIVSGVVLFLFILFAMPVLELLIFGVAFVGWIAFQAYYSTRTSLRYADVAATTKVRRIVKALIGFSNLFCYFVIVVTLGYVAVIQGLIFTDFWLLLTILPGALLVMGFNFVNGLIMVRHRNKPTLVNLALIGLFISLYSAYFIYSAGQGAALGLDLVGIAVSIFFLFYTMSSLGRSLASREDLDTRWKITSEVAVTLTFFLASGYYFSDAIFPIMFGAGSGGIGIGIGASFGDLIKLYIFPFIALVMALIYIRRVGRALEAPEVPEEIPEAPEEEEAEPDEEPEEHYTEAEDVELETEEDLETPGSPEEESPEETLEDSTDTFEQSE